MTAFQILEMKHFMAKLLTEDCFDSFLLEKASVSCAVSYEIDGRVNPEFYQDDETPDAGYLFLPWKSIRPVLFQMIRGKHTPLSFKFVLHLMPQYVPGVMKGADPSLKPEQVQALVLTIKYDGSHPPDDRNRLFLPLSPIKHWTRSGTKPCASFFPARKSPAGNNPSTFSF